MSLGRRVGDACAKMMDTKMRGVASRQIQVDEIWGFIGAKRKTAKRTGHYGDVWTFISKAVAVVIREAWENKFKAEFQNGIGAGPQCLR
jgi:hypothetical protein